MRGIFFSERRLREARNWEKDGGTQLSGHTVGIVGVGFVGKELVELSATDNGGYIEVSNKTGEFIAEMSADEYGNGRVGAWNRKGMGRTLKPGP